MNILDELIGENLIEVRCDEQIIASNEIFELKAEKISLLFGTGVLLKIYTEDLPHFFGEADLMYEMTRVSYEKDNNLEYKKVNKIRLCNWKPKGIFTGKHLSQIEFYDRNQIVLSVGFFHNSNNQIDFIATGELFVSSSPLIIQESDRGFSFEELV